MLSGGIIAIIAMLFGIPIGFLFGLYLGLNIRKTAKEMQREIFAKSKPGERPWGKPRIFVDDRVTGFSWPRSSENLILKIKREEDDGNI